MSHVVNNPDNVIKQLMNSDSPQAMKESVHLKRTGAFQSRTVTVGNQVCTVNQLIKALGKKIKEADVKEDAPNLEKLKDMLTAVSEAEKADRLPTSSLFHLFSSRDEKVDKLQHKVDSKIEEHKAYEALNGGHEVKLFDGDDSDLASNLRKIYSSTRPMNRQDSEGPHKVRIFVNLEPNSKEGNWTVGKKNAEAQEVLFYIQRKSDDMGSSFVIAMANKVDITAEELVKNILDKKIS